MLMMTACTKITGKYCIAVDLLGVKVIVIVVGQVVLIMEARGAVTVPNMLLAEGVAIPVLDETEVVTGPPVRTLLGWVVEMSDESMAPVEDRPIEPAADEALLEYMLDEPAALYIRASTAKW
jgi:hypothetical protein